MKFYAVLTILSIVLAVAAIVDIARIEENRVQHLPKFVWIVISILLSIVGPLLWFLVGRERSAGRAARQARESGHPVGTGSLRLTRVVAPDDDPDFLLQLRKEHEQEERIRKLEEKLAELDDDSKPKD
ncbi:PLD nuclease N-terminal domain-containing protein [Schumannella soli]|uniref:PLDc_N domain-containing protein n=1 Tax=Schumannella soli TaxID=2590779 RepID=A0A506XWD6_9MICO|nr:PLD nuclease N-terminal domain-containing protein [Schumannella soli]TPW74125.1 PLDc_N domain-containing protein [Schumannella soli]